MIISRTPFRLPLGGGGTDLPSYYSKYGGFFISGALNKYMHIVLNKRFEPSIRISYSQTEIVEVPDQIRHPVVREVLKVLNIRDKIEIVSLADAPASTGLGSSGSFSVGLLRALYAYLRITKSQEDIAEEACDIAMHKLQEPSGKQDEYVASLGGIRAYEVSTDGHVTVRDLRLSEDVVADLENGIMMFYTGLQRRASDVLSKQQYNISKNVDSTVEKMHAIKEIGYESMRALQQGNLKRFGELLHEHWLMKKGVAAGMTTNNIDLWYDIARNNGAIGGKILGAGGGGFLMVYCENGRQHVRSALAKQGLVEFRFRFDFEGSKVITDI